jgi:hypothetical protein
MTRQIDRAGYILKKTKNIVIEDIYSVLNNRSKQSRATFHSIKYPLLTEHNKHHTTVNQIYFLSCLRCNCLVLYLSSVDLILSGVIASGFTM